LIYYDLHIVACFIFIDIYYIVYVFVFKQKTAYEM